jgi:hypothetical protein
LRTLVISDLHLGARGDSARLDDPATLGLLAGAARRADRLILLGDVLELRHGPIRDALAAASRVLAPLAESLGPGCEVVIVPGNHDHELLAGWAGRRAAAGPPPPLGLETTVDWRRGESLSKLASYLGQGGATVRAAYPGVWLREDVYASHGHYLDRHSTVPKFERLGAGVMARLRHAHLDEISTAEDYEAVLAPIYAWLFALAQTATSNGPRPHSDHSTRVWRAVTGGRGIRGRTLGAGIGVATVALNVAGMGPLRGELSGSELRRAALRAYGEVLRCLSVDARHVIFGHSHRAGPLPEDDLDEWRASSGARIHNCGCWVHEPAFLGDTPARSPYRAGFAVELDDEGPPRLVNLLDPVTSG